MIGGPITRPAEFAAADALMPATFIEPGDGGDHFAASASGVTSGAFMRRRSDLQ